MVPVSVSGKSSRVESVSEGSAQVFWSVAEWSPEHVEH